MGNFRHKTLSPFKIISFEQTPWRRITLLKDVNVVQGFGDILATTNICRVFSVWTRDSAWLWHWVLGLGDREMRMRCGLTEFVWPPQGHTREHGTRPGPFILEVVSTVFLKWHENFKPALENILTLALQSFLGCWGHLQSHKWVIFLAKKKHAHR